MTGWQRVVWWSLAVVGAGVAVALTVLVVAGDLDTADRLASVVGALVGVAALGVSVYAMTRTVSPGAPSVRAGGGSNAALGSIRDTSARDTTQAPATQAPATPDPGGGISATGGSNAAGGDIDGSTAHRGS